MKSTKYQLPIFLALVLLAAIALCGIFPAHAQEIAKNQPQAKIDTGDTAWVLMSAALVFLMTPGLAFFLRRPGKT